MARLLADENMPLAVVEALRSRGHDVATIVESSPVRGMSDTEVMSLARVERRAVLTLNRRDFFRLHHQQPSHAGIIACTFDPDFVGQAERIHAAVPVEGIRPGTVLRVNRPQR